MSEFYAASYHGAPASTRIYFKRTPEAQSRWHNQISRRFQCEEVRFDVKFQRQGRESAGGQLPPPVIILMIIMAPTLSRPPARIHFLCQAHKKDERVRGKDTKPLQSSNKRLSWLKCWLLIDPDRVAFKIHLENIWLVLLRGKTIRTDVALVYLRDNWKANVLFQDCQ